MLLAKRIRPIFRRLPARIKPREAILTTLLWPKFDTTSSGSSSRLYVTYFGGNGGDHGYGIDVDSGNAYITGKTLSSSSIASSGVWDTAIGNLQDAFIAKINPASGGSSDLVYATYLGGNGRETGYGIVVDGSGLAHVTGGSNSDGDDISLSGYDTTRFQLQQALSKLQPGEITTFS